MLNKYDNFFLNIGERIGNRLAGLTGKGSALIARTLICIPAFLIMIIFIVVFAINLSPLWFFISGLVVFSQWMGLVQHRITLKHFDRIANGEVDVLPPKRNLDLIIMDRKIYTLLALVFVWMGFSWGSVMFWGVYFSYGLVLYIGSAATPPRKSVFARAKDKIKEKVKTIEMPRVKLPTPIPLPVSARYETT